MVFAFPIALTPSAGPVPWGSKVMVPMDAHNRCITSEPFAFIIHRPHIASFSEVEEPAKIYSTYIVVASRGDASLKMDNGMKEHWTD